MLDTIHMNIEEGSILETIRRYGRRIGHFHVCESNGGPFGSGNLDFAAVLATLDEARYDKYVSVKVYRDMTWEDAAGSAMEFSGDCPSESSIRSPNCIQPSGAHRESLLPTAQVPGKIANLKIKARRYRKRTVSRAI